MKRIMALSIFCFAFNYCGNTQQRTPKEDFNKMKWLIGSWKGVANNRPFYEAWRRVNDSVYVNFSIEIKNGDTVVSEGSPIYRELGSVYLGQSPARWKLTRLTDDEMVFENDTLKFSNKIIWHHTLIDHWYTELVNPDNRIAKYDIIRMPELDAVVDRFIQQAMKKQIKK